VRFFRVFIYANVTVEGTAVPLQLADKLGYLKGTAFRPYFNAFKKSGFSR
jgi:hypothetical protein